MKLRVGQRVWLRCEVKPGPFSDERLVKVEVEQDSWVGFVPIWLLRAKAEQGRDEVEARVLAVNGKTFRARIQGHSVSVSTFEAPMSLLATA